MATESRYRCLNKWKMIQTNNTCAWTPNNTVCIHVCNHCVQSLCAIIIWNHCVQSLCGINTKTIGGWFGRRTPHVRERCYIKMVLSLHLRCVIFMTAGIKAVFCELACWQRRCRSPIWHRSEIPKRPKTFHLAPPKKGASKLGRILLSFSSEKSDGPLIRNPSKSSRGPFRIRFVFRCGKSRGDNECIAATGGSRQVGRPRMNRGGWVAAGDSRQVSRRASISSKTIKTNTICFTSFFKGGGFNLKPRFEILGGSVYLIVFGLLWENQIWLFLCFA